MGDQGVPWHISVDDHVVEPPGLWWDRLPMGDRDRGPHVVRDTCETINDVATLRVNYIKGGNGPMTDWWVYEDLAKPVPKVVACAGIPVDEHNTDPINYADMRPGCYEVRARLEDMDVNRTERSLCFPYVPRFCGQMFLEAKDKDLALRCVRAYNDWMIEEWSAPSGGRLLPLGIIPLWDPTGGGRRDQAQRRPRDAAPSRSPRCRTTSGCRRSTTLRATGPRSSMPPTRPPPCCACTSDRVRGWSRRARTRPEPPTRR